MDCNGMLRDDVAKHGPTDIYVRLFVCVNELRVGGVFTGLRAGRKMQIMQSQTETINSVVRRV
jgi:hypothetical protein